MPDRNLRQSFETGKGASATGNAYKMTQRHPAVGSSLSSLVFAPFPVLPFSKTSTTYWGLTLMCTTFCSSEFKRQSNTCQSKHSTSSTASLTFQSRVVVQYSTKVDKSDRTWRGRPWFPFCQFRLVILYGKWAWLCADIDAEYANAVLSQRII